MTIYDLQKKPHHYTYIKDRDYSLISDRFLRNALKALDYLHKTNALTITYEDDGILETVDIIDTLTNLIRLGFTIRMAFILEKTTERNGLQKIKDIILLCPF